MDNIIERRAMINSINDINQYKQVKKDAAAESDTRAASSAQPQDSDRVELSTTSQRMAALRDIIVQAAEVNQARVEYIRQQINVGKYEIFSHTIAEKMLADIQYAG